MEDSFQDFLKDNCDDYADTLMSGNSSEDSDKQASKADLGQTALTGTGDDEQRKTRRRIANRESARRTRQRKADMLRSLSTEVMKLNHRNFLLQAKLSAIAKQHQKASIENQILRHQLQELSMSASLQLQEMGLFGLTPSDISPPQPAPLQAQKPAAPSRSIPPPLDLLTSPLTCLPHLVTSTATPLSPTLLPLAEAPPPTPVTPAANASLPSLSSTSHSPDPDAFTNPFVSFGSPDLGPDLSSYWTTPFPDDNTWSV